MDSRSLVILLVDPDGQRSLIAAAVRRQGHRVVIATGVDTAQIVLGSLLPDVAVVRAQSPERDRDTVARLETIAPEVPVRVLEAPAGLDDALEAHASASSLN
jgi:two-component system nitrogen regulation response regulator GlnG